MSYGTHYETYKDRNIDCPFCGGTRQDTYTHEITFVTLPPVIYYDITCYDCGCTLSGFNTEEDAIKAWNERAEKKG